MYGLYMGDGLQFNDNLIVDNQIKSVCLIKFYIFPEYRKIDLAFYFIPILFQQIFHSSFVCGFQKTGMIRSVYQHRYACDILKECILSIVFRYQIHIRILLPIYTLTLCFIQPAAQGNNP